MPEPQMWWNTIMPQPQMWWNIIMPEPQMWWKTIMPEPQMWWRPIWPEPHMNHSLQIHILLQQIQNRCHVILTKPGVFLASQQSVFRRASSCVVAKEGHFEFRI